jgi:elongation factor 1-gamma
MLETPQGNLVESAAIARYLASQGEGNLAGSDAWETAQINQWVDFSHTTMQPFFYNIVRAVFGFGDPVDSDVYNNSVKEFKEIIMRLNTHLQGKSHLVSNRITVADVAVAVQLIMVFQTVFDAGFRKAIPNVSAWIENFVKLPEVVRRIGNVKFSAKALKPTNVAEKKKEEAPKPVAAPKKPAPTGDDEETEKKPSGKNPLDLLPPSKFVLPDFKTYFVNLGDKKATEGMDHFFQNYDPEGYSIFFVHYDKYEGEGVVLYQTSNLMNGFIQRMDDKFRNYCFSMAAILGEEPNLEIQGVWMFRGKGIPQEMIDHPQFEYYQRRELDVTKAEDKKLITEFWSAKPESIANGLKVQECKMFK